MAISKSILKVFDKKFLLLLIFILGITLRLINLGTESLDFDEVYSVKLASFNLAGIIKATSKDFHPPLYYYLLHLWTFFWGNSEFFLRLLSVIFGTLSIWGIYITAKFIFSETTALFASFLFAISHLNVEFSQEVRMYSLLVLLSIFSMYFLLRLLNNQNLFNFTWFIVFNILLIYTHVYSFFIIAAEYFYFFTLYFYARNYFRNGLRWLFHAAVIIVLAFAPWIFVFFKQFSVAQKLLWIPKASIWGFPESLIEYSGSFLLFLILIPLVFLSFLSVRITSKEKHKDLLRRLECMEVKFSFINLKKVYFLFLWLLFPLILPFTISQFLSPIFLVKYTIAASAAFIVLAASGFSRIRTASVRYSVVILLVFLSLLNFKNDWSVPTKERWKEAISYLNNSAKATDLVIFNAGVCSYLYDYYSRRNDLAVLPLEPKEDQLNQDSLKAILAPYFNKFDRFWLVVSHTRDYNGEIIKTMEGLSDSASCKNFFTNSRKYFFISKFDNNSFDLYLLKSYISPVISVYFYEKKDKALMVQNKKSRENVIL